MITKTSLPDDEQVLSIRIFDKSKMETIKKHLFKKFDDLKQHLIDEDEDELIFLIPQLGIRHPLNHIRWALQLENTPHDISVLIVENGEFQKPLSDEEYINAIRKAWEEDG